MDRRVLLVEDELIIALDLEDLVNGFDGFEVIGLSSNLQHSLELASNADIALVDVNLSDGPSGPEIGRRLSQAFGVSVVFMTGNAEVVEAGVEGTLGVLSKPIRKRDIEETLSYVSALRANRVAPAPRNLKLFSQAQVAAE